MHRAAEMDRQPPLPPGIGPHEGKELDLMLAGEKPLAMFSDIVGSGYRWPDAAFEPYVLSGTLIKQEFFENTPDEKYVARYLYYALPSETWRIKEAHNLNLQALNDIGGDSISICKYIGYLLGYKKEDIEVFLDHLFQINKLSR